MFNSPILESTSPVYQNYKTTQLELIPKPINLTKKLDGTYGAGQDDVLVKIHYASFNPIDILLKGIVSPWVNYLRGNFGLCNDYSGVVVDIGDKAAEKLGLRIGDEVCGQTSQTAYTNTLTEYVMFEGSHYPKGWGMLKKPENLTMAEAGSFGMVYSTAVLLKKTAVFNESTKVLVNGASTSVGKYLISLLKLDPRATEVVAICSGRSAPLIKELGAHKIIDYTQTNSIVNEVLDECKDRLFDVYFDCRGNDKLLYHVTFFLKEDGVYASCGGGKKLDLANASLMGMFTFPFLKKVLLSAVGLLKIKIVYCVVKPGLGYEDVKEYFESGKIKPHIDTVFSFDDYQKAYEYLVEGKNNGKIVVEIVKS